MTGSVSWFELDEDYTVLVTADRIGDLFGWTHADLTPGTSGGPMFAFSSDGPYVVAAVYGLIHCVDVIFPDKQKYAAHPESQFKDDMP